MKRFIKALLFSLTLSLTSSATDITQEIEAIRIRYNLPAIAATLVTDNRVLHVSAQGFRGVESNKLVTVKDKFHLGSNTKSMTGTLLGVMVEKKILHWNTTLEETFPTLDIHEDYKDVNLTQLMRHYGGTTGSLNNTHQKLWHKFFYMQQEPTNNAREQRLMLAQTILTERPSFTPGKEFHYSNTGTTLVGMAIEDKFKKSYEDLLKENLFEKLQMHSCGFGAPATIDQFDHPRGHVEINGVIQSVNSSSITADNPDAISPAGKVHCSIIDWGKYIQEHLKGARGKSHFLATKTFEKLHTPVSNGNSALGWIISKPKWATNTDHIFHNGSNSMNYAEMWVSPKLNYGIGVVTNIGNKQAKQAVRLVVEKLAKSYLKSL